MENFSKLEYCAEKKHPFYLSMLHKAAHPDWTIIDAHAEDRKASIFIDYYKRYHSDRVRTPEEVSEMWKAFNGIPIPVPAE